MNKLLVVLLFAALAGMTAAGEKPGVPRPEPRMYGINWRSVGWRTTVIVNGLPVVRVNAGGGWCPVTNLVVNGANTVEVRAEQLERGADPLTVVVAWGPMSDETATPTQVAEVTGQPGAVGTKVSETHRFQAPMPITWFWQKATPIKTLEAADRAEILSQVRKVYDALVAKKADLCQETEKRAMQDMATYLGISLQEVLAPEKETLSDMFEEEGYAPTMRSDAELKTDVFGPFVLVSAGEWPDDWVIRGATSGLMNYKFRNYVFCKVDGKWYRVT